MPRQPISVKNKLSHRIKSLGLIDLHFHGAYGIDLMKAESPDLDRLAFRLLRSGVTGFCPTTLSAPPTDLLESVRRLGTWIRSVETREKFQGARPLGIHLEGPFIHPGACGAHPRGSVRRFDPRELERLWEASRKTIRILTVAPEVFSAAQLRQLLHWCALRRVRLSLGHSKATQEQTAAALDAGFTGLTHGWNAMPFHHRAPGPLGAALGRHNVYVEIIPDGVHVSPSVVRWTLALHPQGVCFISDCVPSAGTKPGTQHSFGSLRVTQKEGASRLASGELAGGSQVLTEVFRRWIENEAKELNRNPAQLLRESLPCVTSVPLRALGKETKLPSKSLITWVINSRGNVKFHL